MMMRFAPAATLAIAVAFLAGPVSAQTVPDYEAALAAVPGSPAAAVASACRPLQNYVVTAMEPGERKGPWLLSWLPFTPWADDTAAGARRDCTSVREVGVIAFNAGSSEEIVTPPKLDDTDVLVRPTDPATSTQPLPGYDTPSRRTPRTR
ncbi:hypothetical protein [Azospirillum sp. TSO22-1]|uniref:hypothetical protein n=1 Tax=Azospirillum sp. TSO22-1 TaxID=716789 RepID=UPI001304F0AD|nr:hypothetical protein [Azospirillum sp. TSO22-1]